MGPLKWFCWLILFALIFPMAAMGSDFVDNGNRTVTDRETGLMWQQDENCCSAHWLALSGCENLTLAGHTDWRLPNIKELESIVADDRDHPAINKTFFPMTLTTQYNLFSFWSSTANASNTHYFWKVHFATGALTNTSADEEGNAYRCVRGGE